jgi:1-acyl-sn-glycerol-3-phosphate acyltransferase
MRKKLNLLHKILLLLAHLFVRLLFFKIINPCRVVGKENVPPGGGIVVVSNHLSVFDPLLIPSACLRIWPLELMYAPAKAELFENPFLSCLIRVFGGFPVRRGTGDIVAARRIIKLMQEEKMVIFPEGTRSADGRLGEGNRAVGRLLYEARPVVIPAAVEGTEKLLPKGKKMIRPFTHLKVSFGPPLKLDHFYLMEDTKEASQRITDTIMSEIARLQGIDE